MALFYLINIPEEHLQVKKRFYNVKNKAFECNFLLLFCSFYSKFGLETNDETVSS